MLKREPVERSEYRPVHKYDHMCKCKWCTGHESSLTYQIESDKRMDAQRPKLKWPKG